MPICLGTTRVVQTLADIFSVDVFAWKTGEQHDFVEFFTNQLFVANATKYWDYDLRVSNTRMPSVTVTQIAEEIGQ